MEKPRRSVEENKRISISTITILVIALVVWIFVLIFLLFTKAENEKKIEAINNEIETLKLESSVIKEKEEEINTLINNVADPSTYIEIQLDNYKTSLPLIEDKIKDFETTEKIAYLVFVVDKTNNLEEAIEILNNNMTLATFFTNDKDSADKITNNGHLVGLYIDDEKVLSNVKEEYKDFIDSYNPDLFMVSSDLKKEEIKIDSFYRVKENSTSEGKKLLNQEGYINDIVETTADRDFLIIKINISNNVGINSINGIISKLKDKNYIFLPLISSSSLIEK